MSFPIRFLATMGDYKLLNKELIDANRELKQNMATYQKELVLTRAELMEQYHIRVEAEREYRDRTLAVLAHNFLALVRDIDANVNIPELLGFSNYEQSSNFTNGNGKSDSSSSRRRSIHLVREFRRSSAVCHQNSIRMSPARRRYENHAIAEQPESSGSDMDLENSITEDNVIDVENEASFENEDLLCIKEDSEEECEENDSKNCAVVEKRNRQPIRDISNIDMEQVENKGYFVTRRGKLRNRSKGNEKSIKVVPNIEVDNMELEDSLIHALNRSLHVSGSTTTENNVARKAINKENFTRHLVVKLQRMHEPKPTEVQFDTEDHTIMPEEHEISVENRGNDKLSLGITEFSMGNFLEASCSTPCHSMKATTADATIDETTHASSYSLSSQTTSQSNRPSRRCAPKTLAEPNLKGKLRSDSAKRKTQRR